MGLCILAFLNFTSLTANALLILEVLVGLGFVIFVHELGHFAVAKMCGVKCEKFYLGFDIYGLRLCRFQWGETEYGIGILPLGGYVKMLGQDDNPGRAAEERVRSTIVDEPAAATPDAAASLRLDPRSYIAKSVPQRMAIISAGVIMNLIFAVLMASIAFSLGVMENPCAISSVLPGEAAWKADIHPGDRIVKIGDESNSGDLRYRDLQLAVMFSDPQRGVRLEIERDGLDKPIWITVKPNTTDKARLRPTIGVLPGCTTQLDDEHPARPGSLAASEDKFKGGDTIVAVNDAPVSDYTSLISELARHPDETLTFTVERKDGKGKNASTEKVPVKVSPQPYRVLGLRMSYGVISAVQDNSPAAKAGFQAGDILEEIDHQPPGDPLALPDQLRELAGKTVEISVRRDTPGGQPLTVTKNVTLRESTWYDEPWAPGAAMSAPSLGIAYKILNVVHATESDSPAAKAVLEKDGKPAEAQHFVQGDSIVKAEFLAGSAKPAADSEAVKLPDPIEFSDEKPNWPYFCYALQVLPPGTQVRLTLIDGRTAVLEAVDATDLFNPDRGLINTAAVTTFKTHGVAASLRTGFSETIDASLMIYQFLNALITGRVSPKNVQGPLGIFEMAKQAAHVGPAQFLLFLTMLSANLAVINFLPIPLLDGGHMVFLALEGILRRPVSERVVVAFHYLGFVFLISLMLFVLGLDLHLIPRHG